MAVAPRLDLRQTQSLVMTPQLQQAIKLLQLSSIELQAYVETQLEQNPLLERDEAGPDTYGIEDPPVDAVPVVNGEPLMLDVAVGDEVGSITTPDLDLEYFDNVFDSDVPAADASPSLISTASSGNRGGSFEEHDGNAEEIVASRPTLQEHLLSQLTMEIENPGDRIVGVYLMDLLDEAGYLQGDLAAVAEQLGCPLDRVERVLQRLQQFDPPGIFARSLAECLALQLADRDRLDAPMRILLANLPLLAKREWTTLAQLCGVEGEQVMRMVGEIRGLDPKPALAFDHTVTQTVVPDVLMRPQPGGGWIVELNSETLPRLLINNQYYTQISRSTQKREDKQYINECLQSANWLVKSLHQRATTILKVATEIIRQQHGFFINGVQSLRPLVLRDIAEAISMHESTVSRVTSNKFIATPRGIFELKYFFTHAVGGSHGGDGHSAVSVRHRIKAMIDGESAEAIHSDDSLAEMLQKEGIDIARRTVAKYREAMGIPSSVQRRRQKSEAV